MKLLEKLKNTFFEEEYVEVDEPEKKAEKNEEVARKVEKKEEPKKLDDSYKFVDEVEDTVELDNNTLEPELEEKKEEPVYSDREILKRNQTLSYFDEDDFTDDTYYEEKKPVVEKETKKIYGGSANSVYDSIINSETANRPYSEAAGRFHPTPIISPIYGVLDKNYRKEEVIDKKDRPSSYVSRRDASIDSVRKKAYGDISILDTKVEDNVIEETNEPLLYDMIDNEENEKPAVDKVTIADAEEYFEDLGLEYNVDYKDTSYEDATKNTRSTRTGKHKTEEFTNFDKEDINNDVLTEEEIEDDSDENLFDLVDSIYEGGEE